MCYQISNFLAISVLLLLVIRIVDCDTLCNCKPLRECPTFMKYFKSLDKPLNTNTIEFLRSQGCGFHEGFPKICCLSSYPNTHLLKMRTRIPPKKHCPSAICVSLRNCAPIMSFLSDTEKPLKPNIVEFLRRQECGFEYGYPKVCCRLIPKNLKVHKDYWHRPAPRLPFNVLSLETDTNEDLEDLNMFIAITTERAHSTTTKSRSPVTERTRTTTHKTKTYSYMDRKKKEEFLNNAFSTINFFDFSESFDLAVRQKRADMDKLPDVEIR